MQLSTKKNCHKQRQSCSIENDTRHRTHSKEEEKKWSEQRQNDLDFNRITFN